MQEKRQPAIAQARRRLGDLRVLYMGHGKIAAQQLRVDPEQAPARHVELPPVVAEMRDVAGAAPGIDRALAVRRRILAVAEIVIAGQEAHGQADRVMQDARRREVAFGRCSVERDITRVEHEVGLVGPQRRADAHEVVDEERLLVAEMGVGNLGNAEGHAGKPSPAMLQKRDLKIPPHAQAWGGVAVLRRRRGHGPSADS